jgi:ribosomal protein L29
MATELHQLKAEDLRAYDAAGLRETEGEIRKALVGIRMDIYTAKSAHAAKIKGLRRSLARLLTVKNASGKKTAAKTAAPKAAAAAPKAKKAAAPKAKKPAGETKAKSAKATKTATKSK